MHKTILEEIDQQKKRGVLLVVTGPTGAGKDTVFNELVKRDPHIIKVVTTTSRALRQTEQEGNPYYFLSRDEFERLIADHAFFEWVEFRGELYGTQKKTLEDAIASGHDIIWRIDAKGIKNIKQKVKDLSLRSVFVFLTAPAIETLEKRVEKDEGAGLPHRWNESLVKWELEQFDDCEYLVVNEDEKLEQTVHHLQGIMNAKRMEL